MSQNDSFIDEVSEEVRRDRLFRLYRRWVWLVVVIVVLVVAGAAFWEWRKAQERAQAQALGDSIVAALAEQGPEARAAALGLIETDDAARALVDFLIAAETAGTDAAASATVALGAEAARDGLEARWQDLASLKLLLIEAAALPADQRIERLEPLTGSGDPYRVFALEQIAYARAEMGDTDAAIATLRDLLADGEVGEGLRLRASQMIVALGGTPEPA